MLLSFKVKNYKVFKEEQTFSLVAHEPFKEHIDTHVTAIESRNIHILHSAVLYGANASGKSIFIEAIDFARSLILNSFKESNVDAPIQTEPFLLHTSTDQAPSEFEFAFLHQGIQYRYGFVVTSSKVEEEWLYVKDKKEVEYFYRADGAYDYNKSQLPIIQLLNKQNMVRDNALLLSVLAQFNNELALEIVKWLGSIGIISGLDSDRFKFYTINRIKGDEAFKKRVLTLLEAADLGIVDVQIPNIDLPEELEELKGTPYEDMVASRFVQTFRYKYDTANQPLMDDLVSFDLEDSESKGTQKYFALLGPILDTLEKGDVLIIDELDARLHSLLVNALIHLFHDPITNPHHAQLIVATHNTNIMNSEVFRRDQIWYLNKDSYGASQLYGLMNIKTKAGTAPREKDNYELKYLRGQYRGIPALWRFEMNKRAFVTADNASDASPDTATTHG